MAHLPVIVGFGGYNAAGRGSFHQAYQRTVIESLSQNKRQETLAGLASLMKLVHTGASGYTDAQGQLLSLDDIETRYGQQVLDNTLIREIGQQHFDIDRVYSHQSVKLADVDGKAIRFTLSRKKLPDPLPSGWQVIDDDHASSQVTVLLDSDNISNITIPSSYAASVRSAGQLPTGFEPGDHYASRFHPRGLQLSILGASDALNSVGIDWQTLLQTLSPEQIAVYSTSAMSQLDTNGFGGLLQSRLLGSRVSTKQLALGFNSMPADFINAYVLGNAGATSSIAGACASFLYNLQAGMEDIRSGRRRVVIVGSSEAPVTPEIIDGYATMGALATKEKLAKLDNTGTPDYRRTSRPFGENCGFTIAESTQQVVLMDDALAVELGATIYGSVADVFVHADGYKKSISAPGPGNYLTFARAVASARSLLGDEIIRQRSFVQAHGSSTPQNRVTESEILDRVADTFGITQWPVAAVKAYVGHSLAPASGDQMLNSLGVFDQGILPGIKTIDAVAQDVLQQRLHISNQDLHFDQAPEVAFLNSKGFGGNNATAAVLSPHRTRQMLSQRHGQKLMAAYEEKNKAVSQVAQAYHQRALQGDLGVRYLFGQNMINDKEIKLSENEVCVPGFGATIDLTNENIYKDML